MHQRFIQLVFFLKNARITGAMHHQLNKEDFKFGYATVMSTQDYLQQLSAH